MNYRDERRRKLFTEVIEPFFGDLQSGYLEYIQALSQIRTLVEARAPLPDVLARSRDLRDKTAVLRHKIAEVAISYNQSVTASDIRDFVAGAPGLFSSTFDRSDFYEFVSKLEGFAWRSQIQLCGQDGFDHDELSQLLLGMLKTADRNWRTLCGEYGRLRAAYYSPTSIFLGQGKNHAGRDVHDGLATLPSSPTIADDAAAALPAPPVSPESRRIVPNRGGS